MFPSSPYALEAHMDQYIASRRAEFAETRLGQPSLIVRLAGRFAGRIAHAATMIERWTRGATEGSSASVPATLSHTTTR